MTHLLFHNRNQARIISNITYEESYSYYIREIFNSNVVMIINRLCIESKTCPDDLRNNYPLHSLLVKTSKELLLNQLELVYFSLYLDNFGWKNCNFDIMDNLLIVALSVKKYLNHNTDIIEQYLNEEYPDLIFKFNMWLRQQRDFHSNIVISPRVVNERYNLLNKPYNTFCKNNFIDYNESVDKILQMSLPYNETIKPNGDIDIEEDSIDKVNNDDNDNINKKRFKKKKRLSLKVKGKNHDEEEGNDDDSERSDINKSSDVNINKAVNQTNPEVIETFIKEQQDNNEGM